AAEVTAHGIVPARKVFVVPNGIDTSRFEKAADPAALRERLGFGPTVPVIGTMGRLSEVKRQDLLLDASPRRRPRLPEARLLLVGDGPMLSSLRAQAAQLGLEGAIHYAGYQPEPERYLQVMDVFALTSRSEGMPLAVLE